MSTSLYTLVDLCALSLVELNNLRKKLQLEKNKTALLDLLHCIKHLHEKRLFSESDLELTTYSSYVLEHSEAFIQNACKRAQLPIVLATLKIACVETCPQSVAKEEVCCKTIPKEEACRETGSTKPIVKEVSQTKPTQEACPRPVTKEVCCNSKPTQESCPQSLTKEVSPTKPAQEIMLVYPPKQLRKEEFILNKRKQYVASALRFTGVSNPATLNIKVLEHFFVNINKDFFDDLLPLPSFSVSKKLRNAGAYFQPSRKGNKIAFSAMRFADAFSNGKQQAMSSGLRCNNRLEWVEITMEHEMIHYFIHFSQFEKQNPGVDASVLGRHGSLFRDLSVQLFGHKSINCQTADTSALATIEKSMVRKGMTVTFRSAEGGILTGVVARVNPKTVTIPWGPTMTRYVYYSSLLSCG